MWTKNNGKVTKTNPRADAVAKMIAGRIKTLEKKVVRLLQGLERRLTNMQKITALAIFVFISSAFCSYTFFKALFNDPAKRRKTISDYGHVAPVAQPPPLYFRKDTAKEQHIRKHK